LLLLVVCISILVNVGLAGTVQSADQSSTSLSQGLESRYASANQSRDLREPFNHCRTGISA